MMTRQEPWFMDVATHPLSPLQPLYMSGRLNNMLYVQCPYCNGICVESAVIKADPVVKCIRCNASYTYSYSEYHGFNSRPLTCRDRHMYVLCYIEDDGVKTCKCIMCEAVRRTTGSILSSNVVVQEDVDARMREIRT